MNSVLRKYYGQRVLRSKLTRTPRSLVKQGKDRKIGLRDSQDHYILTRRDDFTKVNGGTSDQTLSRRW